MNYRLLSVVLIVLTAVGLIAYDFLPFASPPDGDTLSETMRDAGAWSSAVPFGWGFLGGHFFVQGVRRRLPHEYALGLAALLAFVVHLVGLSGVAALFAGIATGALVWPLEPPAGDPPAV